MNIIVVTSLITAVSLICFSFFFLSPSFTHLIVKNAESDAVKVGRYLSKSFRDKDKITRELPSGFVEIADQALADFGLMKIKVFASDGETVYSTAEKDIGKINEKDYFHNIVAQGRVFSKVVYKDTMSLEDQVVSKDVVETYVPIINDGSFVGAFEVYFDISATKNELENLLFNSNALLLLIAVGLLLAVLVISFIARHSIIKQESAEAEREQFIAELKKALNEIKTLHGIIPICSYCKKIRDEKGQWNPLEAYIHQHSGADFSHSLCPDCSRKEYEKIDKDSINTINHYRSNRLS